MTKSCILKPAPSMDYDGKIRKHKRVLLNYHPISKCCSGGPNTGMHLDDIEQVPVPIMNSLKVLYYEMQLKQKMDQARQEQAQQQQQQMAQQMNVAYGYSDPAQQQSANQQMGQPQGQVPMAQPMQQPQMQHQYQNNQNMVGQPMQPMPVQGAPYQGQGMQVQQPTNYGQAQGMMSKDDDDKGMYGDKLQDGTVNTRQLQPMSPYLMQEQQQQQRQGVEFTIPQLPKEEIQKIQRLWRKYFNEEFQDFQVEEYGNLNCCSNFCIGFTLLFPLAILMIPLFSMLCVMHKNAKRAVLRRDRFFRDWQKRFNKEQFQLGIPLFLKTQSYSYIIYDHRGNAQRIIKYYFTVQIGFEEQQALDNDSHLSGYTENSGCCNSLNEFELVFHPTESTQLEVLCGCCCVKE